MNESPLPTEPPPPSRPPGSEPSGPSDTTAGPVGSSAPTDSWATRVAREVEGIARGFSRVAKVHAARAELRARSLVGQLLLALAAAVVLLVALAVAVWMLLAGLAGLLAELTGRAYAGQLIVGSVVLIVTVVSILLLGAVVRASGEKSIRNRFQTPPSREQTP